MRVFGPKWGLKHKKRLPEGAVFLQLIELMLLYNNQSVVKNAI